MTHLLVSDPHEVALLQALRESRDAFNRYPTTLDMHVTVTRDGAQGQVIGSGWDSTRIVNTLATKPQAQEDDE